MKTTSKRTRNARTYVATIPSLAIVFTILAAMPITASAANGPPTNLTATAGAGGITLNWQDNSNNEDMFSIYRKEGSGSFTLIRSVSANTTTYTDATAEGGKTYTYYVVAVKVGVPGFSKSNEATATMPAAVAIITRVILPSSRLSGRTYG